jgi:membrane protease YdiL (CAAX protease family)
MRSLINLKTDHFGFKTIFHASMGIAILLIGNLSASLVFDLLFYFSHIDFQFFRILISPVMTIVISTLLIYIYIAKILKMQLSDFRICKPEDIITWVLYAIILPFSISCVFLFLVPGTFTRTNLSSKIIVIRIINAVLSIGITTGITEELIFRGFIMRLLELRWNKYIAIIIPSIFFGLLHIINLKYFNAGDVIILLIASTSAGIMFSTIAYKSRSIWPAAIVHGIWNMIIIGGIFGISIDPEYSIFTYTLGSNYIFLTGGEYGIESSLIAIIGYVVITISIWFFQHTLAFPEK